MTFLYSYIILLSFFSIFFKPVVVVVVILLRLEEKGWDWDAGAGGGGCKKFLCCNKLNRKYNPYIFRKTLPNFATVAEIYSYLQTIGHV